MTISSRNADPSQTFGRFSEPFQFQRNSVHRFRIGKIGQGKLAENPVDLLVDEGNKTDRHSQNTARRHWSGWATHSTIFTGPIAASKICPILISWGAGQQKPPPLSR